MRTAVLCAGVALVLLSQAAIAQVNPAVGAALGQANAALGQANAILGSLGINPGTGTPSPAIPPGTGTPSPAIPPGTGTPSPAIPVAAAPPTTAVTPPFAAALPTSLRPLQQGNERSTVYWSDMGVLAETRANSQALRVLLRNRPGTPPSIVQICRNAVATSAIPYGAVGLDTAAAGPVRRTPTGYRVTIAARVLYSRSGSSQVRQATFSCQLNQAGQVVAMR
jgi:hypothetical protein